MNKKISAALFLAVSATFSVSALAADNDCTGLPTNAALLTALKAVVATAAGGTLTANAQGVGSTGVNGGLDFPMWATVVNQYGRVCAVVSSGTATQRAWPASRVISAQKANTANSLSSDFYSIGTPFLFAATQPGAGLFGLQHSNPVNTIVAYRGDATTYGTTSDPMVGLRIGGVNVFGGGLALYKAGKLVGAVGVSGDTSCADHNIAWALRKNLSLASAPNNDNISYNTAAPGSAPNGHAKCDATLNPPM